MPWDHARPKKGGERALFAVLGGKIEVVKTIDGIERTLGWRLPGTIFGEVPITLGTPFPGGYRAAEPPAPRVTIVGQRWDTTCSDLRRFLARNQISFRWLMPDAPELATLWPGGCPPDADLPALKLADGPVIARPNVRDVAKRLGLQTSFHGVFACGDVRLSPVKRVASAVGEGSMAIAFVQQYLAQVCPRIAQPHVAGAQPAADQDLAIGLGPPPVTGGHHRAAHPELAGGAVLDVLPEAARGDVDDAQLDLGHRATHEAATLELGRARDGEPDGLGHAPADLDGETRHVQKRTLQRERQLVAAGEDRVDRGEVRALCRRALCRRVTGHLPEVIDVRTDHRRSLRAQVVVEARDVELALEGDGAASPEDRKDLDPAAHVADRVVHDHARVAVDAVESREHAAHDASRRRVRMGDALRQRGRARGVEDQRERLGGNVGQISRRGVEQRCEARVARRGRAEHDHALDRGPREVDRGQIGELLLVYDQPARARVGEAGGDLGRCVDVLERHRDHSCAPAAEIAGDQLDAVRQ